MAQTICFANNKGGVGKTTTCLSIGQAWAIMGKKILFVDLDSQANLTSLLSKKDPGDQRLSIRDAFLDKNNLEIETVSENIDLIASELSLSNFDIETASITGREYLLLDLLHDIKDNYDFILIDCPPALGLISYNALIASDHLVMVSSADALSYQGLVMVAQLYSDVKSHSRLNSKLNLTAVIVTRYEKNKLSEMYLEQISQELKGVVIEPVIRKATKVQQAAASHVSIFDFDPNGKATQDYLAVAEKLALRIMAEE